MNIKACGQEEEVDIIQLYYIILSGWLAGTRTEAMAFSIFQQKSYTSSIK